MPPLTALPVLPVSAPVGAMPGATLSAEGETADFSAILGIAATVDAPAVPDIAVAPLPVPAQAQDAQSGPVLPASGKILPVLLPPALPQPMEAAAPPEPAPPGHEAMARPAVAVAALRPLARKADAPFAPAAAPLATSTEAEDVETAEAGEAPVDAQTKAAAPDVAPDVALNATAAVAASPAPILPDVSRGDDAAPAPALAAASAPTPAPAFFRASERPRITPHHAAPAQSVAVPADTATAAESATARPAATVPTASGLAAIIAAPPLAVRPRPAPIGLAITATLETDSADPAAPLSTLLHAEAPRPVAQPVRAAASPAPVAASSVEQVSPEARPPAGRPGEAGPAAVQPPAVDLAPAPAFALDIRSIPQPVAVAAPASADVPLDFAGLIDRIATARAALQPQVVAVAVPHAEFGTVRIRFRHEDDALAVSLASADPGFRAAVAAALPPVQAAQPAQPDPRTADQQGAAARQDGAAGAGQQGSQQQRAPQQQRADTTPARNDHHYPDGRRQPGRSPESAAQGGIYA